MSDPKIIDPEVQTQTTLSTFTVAYKPRIVAKADESVRLKSEFLATITHELRTPLSVILGYVEVMQMGHLGEMDASLQRPLQQIDKNSRHLLTMINDILDLSKIEAGHLELNEGPLDIRTLVEEWRQHIEVLAARKALTLEVHIADAFPRRILADQERLSQIATNLLANAVKFTDEGGVTLRLNTTNDARWRLSVTDTGVGIPPEAQQYIFEQFRQADGRAERRHSGTGLGLAIVQRLVERMNGRIWLESEVNQGSTFSVELPLRLPEKRPQPEASANAP